jgi:dTDP-4-amino-4,6-dideoxygalactose transaminase
MSNIFAAIGRVQLTRLDTEFGPKRQILRARYRELLNNNPNIGIQATNENAVVIPHIFPIRVLNGKRDRLAAALQEAGVQTGIHYKPNHLLNYYGGGQLKLPVTEQVYSEIITLPLHPELEIGDIDEICGLINSYI